MASPKGSSRNTAGVDNATSAMIYDGVTKSQMVDLFKMDIRTVNRRLSVSDVVPSGKRNGYDIYHIRDVAPWLLPPKMDIERYIQKMNPQDLPKMLTKEFWNGLKARQDYRLRENELWETVEVHTCLSEMVQVLVMSSRTIEDQVDRLAELSREQRKVLRDQITSLINSLREAAESHFKKRKEKKANKGELGTVPDGQDADDNESIDDGIDL